MCVRHNRMTDTLSDGNRLVPCFTSACLKHSSKSPMSLQAQGLTRLFMSVASSGTTFLLGFSKVDMPFLPMRSLGGRSCHAKTPLGVALLACSLARNQSHLRPFSPPFLTVPSCSSERTEGVRHQTTNFVSSPTSTCSKHSRDVKA